MKDATLFLIDLAALLMIALVALGLAVFALFLLWLPLGFAYSEWRLWRHKRLHRRARGYKR